MILEILQGPAFDGNSKDYYDGAMELLQKFIDDGKLVVKSGKTTFDDVKGDSWDVAEHDHRQEPEGHGQQHRADCQQPDKQYADYRQPDRRRHSDHLLKDYRYHQRRPLGFPSRQASLPIHIKGEQINDLFPLSL